MSRSIGLGSAARGVWALSFIFSLSIGVQPVTRAQSSTEARLRGVVDRFFDAYCKKDLDGVLSVWSKESPESTAAMQKLRESFGSNDKIELKSLRIQKVEIESRKASMRLVIEMNAIEARTGKPALGFGRINRTFRFVQEGEDWKVWQYLASEEEFAASLVQAKTESERNALLAAEKELLTDDLVQALIAQGRALGNQGQYQSAMTVCRLALQLAEQLNDKGGIAGALNGVGNIYYWQGDYSEAMARYQRGAKLAEASGDSAQLASSLRNIGTVYDSQGNYARAFEYYQKSLRLCEQIGDKAGIARALNNLGIVHRLQGNFVQALEYLQKSLKLRQELGDEFETNSALSNLGEVYTAQGNYTQAAEYLQKSLKLSESLSDKAGLAQTLGNLGILSGLQGDYPRALEYLQRNLELSQGLGDKAGIAITLNNIGETRFKQGGYAQAAEMLGQAATLAKQIDFPEIVWLANSTAGRAYRALHQIERARQCFLTAIDTVEEMRGQVGGGEQDQQRFFESRLSPYYGMVDLFVEQENSAEALFYAERSKGRVLLDVLKSGRISVTKAMTGEEQEHESKLRAEAVALNLQLSGEASQLPGEAARLSDLKARLQKARLEYEAFQSGLYAAHPELKVQRGRMQPLTLDQISRLIPDAGTALLEFAVLDDKTFLFVLKRRTTEDAASVDLQVYTLPVKQKELEDLTQRFTQRLAERRLNTQELSTRLYDLLLKPVRGRLQGLNALIIVPDDVLWQLPFQALQPANHRYLIEDYAISYAPSLTVLREMMNQRLKPPNATRGLPTLLAFGNPATGSEAAERVKTVLTDERLAPLPEAERQVKLLSRLYGRDQSRIYIGSSAEEGRFKAEAGNYRILHLATHGILNNASPMYSQLVLSPSLTNNREDGLLEAWEIMKLDLRADLVVLTACETARGRIGAGEGIIGLSWALFVAGAPTAIVSQWKVESASTTELMVEFHRQIKYNSGRPGTSYNAASALRLATLKLLRSKQYDHPFYWAPFVVIGIGS